MTTPRGHDVRFDMSMKKPAGLLTGLMLLACQSISRADVYHTEDTLTIDEPVPETIDLDFADSDDLEPKTGAFKITSSLLMSNLAGERWATVTIRNLSTNQRILDKEHIVAIFANGEKRHPLRAAHRFSGLEQTTLILNFGRSKFPILKVSVRN